MTLYITGGACFLLGVMVGGSFSRAGKQAPVDDAFIRIVAKGAYEKHGKQARTILLDDMSSPGVREYDYDRETSQRLLVAIEQEILLNEPTY